MVMWTRGSDGIGYWMDSVKYEKTREKVRRREIEGEDVWEEEG